MCNILKSSYKLPFLYTSSNAEFKKNYSAPKNSEFVEESINEMLRSGTIKEFLTKSNIINPLSVPAKGKKRLNLGLKYINNHLFLKNLMIEKVFKII